MTRAAEKDLENQHHLLARMEAVNYLHSRHYTFRAIGKAIGTNKHEAEKLWRRIRIIGELEANLSRTNLEGEVSLKEFVANEAAKRGCSLGAIYMRIERKKYPDLKFRRVNKRVVFVKIVPTFRTELLPTQTERKVVLQ